MGAPVTSPTPARTPTRRRRSSSKKQPLPTPTRSDIWFADGNIVLIAANVAFKVHRGQLRRHSEVFDDLFSIPQPKHQDLYDGCPWIEIFDSPSDVMYFLRALYDGLYFKTPGANDFAAIAAVLRLSSKYLVEHLRQRCLTRLEIDWPSSLSAWDHREMTATDSKGHYSPRSSCPHPILVVDLVLELGLSAYLPAAMYDLARYGPSKIMAGTPALVPLTFTPDAAPPTPHQPRTLPHPLLVATLRGREAAQRYLAEFVVKELQNRPPAVDCLYAEDDLLGVSSSGSRVCRESFYFIMLNVLRSVGGIACGRDADPLFTLVQAMDMLSRMDFSDGHRQCGLKLCHPCKIDFAKAASRAREEVWRLLPVWFGLQPAGAGTMQGDEEEDVEMK